MYLSVNLLQSDVIFTDLKFETKIMKLESGFKTYKKSSHFVKYEVITSDLLVVINNIM